MIRILTVISLIFLTSGCTLYRINSEELTSDYYKSKQSADDVMYIETLDKPHEVIGRITVNAERRQRVSEVVEKMKKEAAILGGDVITDIQSDATGEWKSLPAQQVIGNAYVRANFSATVAVIK
ncbi:hypothetical protein ACFL49_01725 [Candidatus Omnitrophota bacterium]